MQNIFFKPSIRNASLSLGASTLALMTGLLSPTKTHGHCGASGCNTNIYWETQGVWAFPGTLFDLSFQYIDQDRLIGAQPMAHGRSHGHEPERVVTRQTTLRVSHGFNEQWGVELSVPWIDRRYEDRRFGPDGSRLDLTEYSKPGDLRLLGRYQFGAETSALNYGMRFGFKLPTGDFRETSSEGRSTDRRLQPGTGTTDVILSGFVNGTLPWGERVHWFGVLGVQEALSEHRGYAPGTEVTGDLGLKIPLLDSLDLLGQLNAIWSDRDRGERGFPRDSGGTILSISPGLRYWATDNLALYSLLEVPFYRDLNGEQLVNQWALTAGVGIRF